MTAKHNVNPSSGISLAIIRTVVSLSLILFLLLFFAWSFDYWQAYLYTLANTAVLSVTLFVLRKKPEIIHERVNPGPGMKKWDKLYFQVSTPLYFILLLVAALDAGRFGWTKNIPIWAYIVCYAVYFLAQGVFLWAKTENPFLSPVVRIQKERGHHVISSGPYRFVRHPSYLSGILFTLATPIMLGSWWALVPAALSACVLVARTLMEDDTLQKELPGYRDYAKKVRHILVPWIW